MRSANGMANTRRLSSCGREASTIDCRRLVAGIFHRSGNSALGRRLSAAAATEPAPAPSPRSIRYTCGHQRLGILAGGALRRRQIVFFLAANAEEPLLQLAVGGERARFHDAVDAAVDHDGDVVGNAGRDADILLDDQDGHRALFGELHHHGLDLLDNDRRQPFRRLVHDQEARIAETARARSPASVARRRIIASRRWCAAHRGAETSGRRDRPSMPPPARRSRPSANVRRPRGSATPAVPAARNRRRGGG